MPRMEGTTLHAILAPGKKAEPVKPKPAAPPKPPAASDTQATSQAQS